MQEAGQNLLQRFKAKKTEKDSVALQEARRLVNLYRSLSCFGDGFLNEYNKLLLNTKPGVRRLLSTFMGGNEVEEYLEFLLDNAHLSGSEEEQKADFDVSQSKKGYLPTPDADLQQQETSDGMIKISKEEWEKMKSQYENLMKQLKLLSGTAKTVGTSAERSDFENYSEIIEDTSGR